MSTIYLNNPPKPIRPPHSNDCNGHNTSISVGGNGQIKLMEDSDDWSNVV